MLPGAQKDGQQITEDWNKLGETIEGVSIREVRHVPRDHGVITEIFRPEWDPGGGPVVHIYQSRLFPGALGAWSCHQQTTDRLFVSQGLVKIVLYDAREHSKSKGRLYGATCRRCEALPDRGAARNLARHAKSGRYRCAGFELSD